MADTEQGRTTNEDKIRDKATRLGERLRALGIRALPGRRATLLQLAAEVPAAVLAELLHLTPGTATRWTRDAAELARERSHQI